MSPRLKLAERCTRAAKAYDRVLAMEDKGAAVSTQAVAAGMVLAMHGDLFAECAAALRETEEKR